MKGVSPLIATVLLIAVAVLLASTISTWVTGLTKDQSVTLTNRSTEITECAGKNMRIEDVYLDFTANISRVNVRNTGQVDETIVSAFLLNQQGVNTTLNSTLPVTLKKGEMKTIQFFINGTITACANFSQARISTLCVTDTYKKTATNC
ncbi:MAG: type IV pilin [Candidatus Aenigmarchaeota archaeon]|nr:type IV pilin [Candidatus Aenigmarchaeota archaeon]